MRRPGRILHVTNGDSTASLLERAGLGGTIAVAAEPLYEGPTPFEASDEQWRDVRARHYESCGWGTHGENLARLESWDAPLRQLDHFDEIVLWFEHDLFDQLILIRLLSRLDGRASLPPVTHLGIDRHASVERFLGLGQLEPGQFPPLFEQRAPVTSGQFRLAGQAWRAVTSPDPRRIESILAEAPSPLPFLGAALRRYLEEFPEREDGLSRTERQVLRLVNSGWHSFLEIFRQWMEEEPAPFLGDGSLLGILQRLAIGPVPLLRCDQPASLAASFDLTDAGRRVLTGQANWLDLNPNAQRWQGGVRVGGGHPWRWDAAAGRLIAV